jgi:hypothetical protein
LYSSTRALSTYCCLQVDALRSRDQQQVLPWLVDLLEGGQQQRGSRLQEVIADLRHFWEMPAQHLLPDTKCEYGVETRRSGGNACLPLVSGFEDIMCSLLFDACAACIVRSNALCMCAVVMLPEVPQITHLFCLVAAAGAADEGKNCSQWLMEIQALHGRKRELSSQPT